MPKLTYTTRPEGRIVSDGRLSILLHDDTLSNIKAKIRQEAKDARDEAGDPRIDPDKWSAEAERLCELAERVVSPEPGFNIFEYLPLTKAGKFPKNRNIVIADSKCGYGATYSGVSNDYPTAYRLQVRLFPAYANRNDWLAGKTMDDMMVMDINLFDAMTKKTPIFDETGTPHIIVSNRASYLKDEDIKTGCVYEEKSGTRYLCVTGLDVLLRSTLYDDEYDAIGKHDPVPMHLTYSMHAYVRWTSALEKAVGENTGFNNIVKAMAVRDKNNSIRERLSQRTKPRKFTREVNRLFDPKDIRHETIIGARIKHPYHDTKEVQFEYEIMPYKTPNPKHKPTRTVMT